MCAILLYDVMQSPAFYRGRVSILYYVPVLSSYVGDRAALPRMSANADFSTLLKCLASGKKSIERLRPSAPRQTSALELLVVYCFRILIVYPCACACPTPPGLTQDNGMLDAE